MMKRFISVITGFALALSVCIGCPVNTLGSDSVTAANAAYDTSENPFNCQDDQAVEYDRRRWVQPPEWNCPRIDPKDYTGGIMLYFDKIGVAPERAPGAVQRVYFSIIGATEPVSHIKFHFFYDTRLTVVQNDNNGYITPGKGLSGFTTGSAMVEEGQLVFYAYSNEDILLDNSSIFTVDFRYPDDAEQGEIYPFGLAYTVDDVAADTFIGSQQDDAGRLQMTYVFTKGIYNGYLKVLGERITTTTTATVTTTTTTTAAFLLGDVNGDGMADSVDSSMILVHNAMAADNKKYLTDEQFWRADINDDLLADSVDASLILAYNAYLADEGDMSLIEWYESLTE